MCFGCFDLSGLCVCFEGWLGVNCIVVCVGILIVGIEVCGGYGMCNVGIG